ncbi:hypothetical protein J6590_089616 [Homalodisca vitripennis]|nr:hypothetical protein J6590_089616 [Homalodisca vitripennis]
MSSLTLNLGTKGLKMTGTTTNGLVDGLFARTGSLSGHSTKQQPRSSRLGKSHPGGADAPKSRAQKSVTPAQEKVEHCMRPVKTKRVDFNPRNVVL